MPYLIGTHVRSIAVGTMPEFDGIVIENCHGSRGYYYHVRCPAGQLWARDSNELTSLRSRTSPDLL